MSSEGEGQRSGGLSPDEAFGVLGNEDRIQMLRVLGEADGLLSFSELRERVGMRDSGQFNYHLDKLEGHFVRRADEGYALRQAGRRVVQSVLSGTVTDAEVVSPTELDAPCPYCGAAIEIRCREEAVLVRCTDCAGSFAGVESTSTVFDPLPDGTLTMYYLPSAGVQGRSPRALLEAALEHTYLELVAMADGICPRCTASVEHRLDVCHDHADEGICDSCHGRFALNVDSRCPNCHHVTRATIKHHLLGDPAVRTFFESRGIDTLAPTWEDVDVFYTYAEEVVSTDPLEATVTFTVDDDRLVVRVDDGPTVAAVGAEPAAGSSQ